MSASSPKFEEWWNEVQRTGSLGAVEFGSTREVVRSLIGELEATGDGFRRSRKMRIWRFGAVEFQYDREGRLYLVYMEEEDGTPRVIAARETA